jgi:3-polyprenyl-4-hydroxybenzoate decarboxylase
LEISASAVKGVVQARMLRSSMLVVTTNIEGNPKPESSMEEVSEEGAARQREVIRGISEAIWSLEAAQNLRWLFITDDDAYLASDDWRRRLLWQLFCRFDVGRDLHFDDSGGRVAWDATAPIPSDKGPLPVRRWPGVTLHDPEVAERVDSWLAEGGY